MPFTVLAYRSQETESLRMVECDNGRGVGSYHKQQTTTQRPCATSAGTTSVTRTRNVTSTPARQVRTSGNNVETQYTSCETQPAVVDIRTFEPQGPGCRMAEHHITVVGTFRAQETKLLFLLRRLGP
jgi:hypothetical protein